MSRKCHVCDIVNILSVFYDYSMSYVFYNPNPRHRQTGDCVPRALSKALDMDWEQAYILLASEGFDLALMPDKGSVWRRVLKQHGYKSYLIPDTCPDCYTIKDFAQDHPYGVYVMAIEGEPNHVVTISNGDWYDTWDSGDEVPTYYMTRKE